MTNSRINWYGVLGLVLCAASTVVTIAIAAMVVRLIAGLWTSGE